MSHLLVGSPGSHSSTHRDDHKQRVRCCDERKAIVPATVGLCGGKDLHGSDELNGRSDDANQEGSGPGSRSF